MTAKLLLSIIIFSVGALAVEVTGQEVQQIDPINEISAKYNVINSSQKIRYVKNPCEGIKGYHFNSFRGFGFEDGIVKKFKNDGTLSYDKAASLGEFLQKRSVCKPVNKSIPALNISIETLEIW